MRRSIRLAIFVFLALMAASASAQEERILDYHSDIVVSASGDMRVTETIRVIAAGNEIRHGIYRDFPTRYRDMLGNDYTVGFEVLGAYRDGDGEPFRTSSIQNGIRVYLGNSKRYVPNGEHTYVIEYATNRQLGYFADHDELYWNVTGNGWKFPIDAASATVTLPGGIPRSELRLEGYTGPQGSRARNLESEVTSEGGAGFRTTVPLEAGEGMTIVVSFPKGFVAQPTAADKTRYFLHDNGQALVGIAGCAIVFVYYLFVWFAVGRDPERGTIVTQYEPPSGLSPAGIRFLMRMSFDQKTFASAVLDMAVRGYLTIEDDDGTYVLNRTKSSDSALTTDERVIAGKLFEGRDHIRLETKYHTEIGAALKELGKSLSATEEKVYFLSNRSSFIPGLLITIVILLLLVLQAPGEKKFIAGFMCLWLSGWSIGVYGLLSQVVRLWTAPAEPGMHAVASKAGAGALSLFSIPFVIGECVGIAMFAYAVSVPGVIALLGLVAINVVFHQLLKAPTRLGRMLMDQVEGFKEFLSAVDGDRMNRMSVEKTPALFEKYLPYALALDIERAWADQFSTVLAAASQREGGYSPAWYTGAAFTGLAAADFATSFAGGFSSAIAASASAPGSSSGSGGGGSSGGGGGGGGGGGW